MITLWEGREVGIISDDALRFDTVVAKQTFNSVSTAPLLHDEIQDFALVIDRSPLILQTISSRCQRGGGGGLCDLRADLVRQERMVS